MLPTLLLPVVPAGPACFRGAHAQSPADRHAGRRREPIEAVVADIGGMAVAGDTRDAAHAAQAVATAVATFGGLDIVVASAGLGFVGSAGDIDDGQRGIRSNTLCPGWVVTPMGDDAMDAMAAARGMGRQDAYDLATAHVPLRRAATGQEIASCCLFLASDESPIVTGTTLVADGGGLAVDLTSTAFRMPTR